MERKRYFFIIQFFDAKLSGFVNISKTALVISTAVLAAGWALCRGFGSDYRQCILGTRRFREWTCTQISYLEPI
jgi:hypothetical protein